MGWVGGRGARLRGNGGWGLWLVGVVGVSCGELGYVVVDRGGGGLRWGGFGVR